MHILAIALGGALGAVLRYLVAVGSDKFLSSSLPFGTFIVNVTGSFLMGFVVIYYLQKSDSSLAWQGFVMIGLLGAFTTFSTFSIETINLFQAERYLAALGNIVLSVVVCLAGTWGGIALGRFLYP